MKRQTRLWALILLLVGLPALAFSHAFAQGEQDPYSFMDEMFELASDYRTRALHQASSYEEAIKICNEGILFFAPIETDYPEAASLLYDTRAGIYLSREKYEEAILDCKKAIELNPQFMGPRMDLARAYTGLGATDPRYYQNALEVFTHNIKMDPDNDFQYIYRAEFYGLLEEYDKAMADIDFALNLWPGNGMAYCTKAKILFSKGAYEKALETVNYALEILDEGQMYEFGEPLRVIKDQIASMGNEGK